MTNTTAPASARIVFLEVSGNDATLEQAIRTIARVFDRGSSPAIIEQRPAAALPSGSAAAFDVVKDNPQIEHPPVRRIPRSKPARTLGGGGESGNSKLSDEQIIQRAYDTLQRGGEAMAPSMIWPSHATKQRALEIIAKGGHPDLIVSGDYRKQIRWRGDMPAPGPAQETYPTLPPIDVNDLAQLRQVDGELAESWDQLAVESRRRCDLAIRLKVLEAAPRVDDTADLQTLFTVGFIRRQAREFIAQNMPEYRLVHGGTVAERIAQ